MRTRKTQTVLLVNPTQLAKAVSLRGMKGDAATLYLTDATRDMAPQKALAIADGAANWTLPPRSICVLVAR